MSLNAVDTLGVEWVRTYTVLFTTGLYYSHYVFSILMDPQAFPYFLWVRMVVFGDSARFIFLTVCEICFADSISHYISFGRDICHQKASMVWANCSIGSGLYDRSRPRRALRTNFRSAQS